MHFGPFAPFGLLVLGPAPADAYRRYRSMMVAVEKAFDGTDGTHVEATLYARALAFAGARRVLRHGLMQRFPMLAAEMLPALERLYGLQLSEATLEVRRRAVAARKLLVRGASASALSTALGTLLGADFVRVRAIKPSERVTWPVDPAVVGSWDTPGMPPRYFRILSGVWTTGTPFEFTYETLLDDGAVLAVGDKLTAGVEIRSHAELVTITAVNNDVVPHRATATFAQSHDVGASLRTHAPMWTANQRALLVVVSARAAADVSARRRIDDLLRRIVRGTTCWAIVKETAPGQLGPFTLGTSPLDQVTLGTVVD